MVDNVVDPFINTAKILVMIYVVLKIVEILYNIPVPLI